MSNQPFSTLYRPTDFDEVLGQNAVVDILNNQIKNKTFRKVILFSGPSGVGKTTLAKIFARKINDSDNPDILEIDGASNNGVDNIRNIIKIAKERSLISKYKVIIIDECHQLTKESQNALLTIFEECPETTIFILATTDPQKLLNTIITRAQHFKLSKLSNEDIITELKKICEKEKIQYEDNALFYIATLSYGSMRQSITILDTCSSFNEPITVQLITKALGVPDILTNCDLLYNLYLIKFSNDEKKISESRKFAIDILESSYKEGKDIKTFINQFYSFVLDIIKYKQFNSFLNTRLPNSKDIVDDCSKYELNNLNSIRKDIKELKSNLIYDNDPLYTVEGFLFD